MPPRKKQKLSKTAGLVFPRETSPPPPETPKPFPFLKLPAELRESVYSYLAPNAISNGYKEWITSVSDWEKRDGLGRACGWDTKILLENDCFIAHSFDSRFFLVCRQIHGEASALFYRSTHLHMFLSTVTNATHQDDNGAGPSNAKYQLRSRRIFPEFPGMIHSHILGRFRRVTVHFDLGRTAMKDVEYCGWKLARWQFDDVAAAMSKHHRSKCMKPELNICFWEPSVMLSEAPFHAYKACYLTPTRIVAWFERARQYARSGLIQKDLDRIWPMMPRERADISYAIIQASTRHEHQLRTITTESGIFDFIDRKYGKQISLGFGRDFHHMPVWTFHPALQPLYVAADEFYHQWHPEKADEFISDSELEVACEMMSLMIAKIEENPVPGHLG